MVALVKAILDRLLGLFRQNPPPAAANDVAYDALDDMRSYVRRDVASGFYDRAQILQNAEDAFEGELDVDVLRKEAAVAVDHALAEYLADQSSWPAMTDCDRLDAAFADLEAEGIVARQNFTCCGTCGAAEIWDEAKVLMEMGQPVAGYAFYHMQDTERAVEGDGVYLNYGAADGSDEAAVAVGHRIVRQLENHGLTTEWNGSVTQRIALSLDWKRRRQNVASQSLH